MSRLRETWIDNTKVFACILVAVGHLFQSMTTAQIISETELTRWLNSTLYYFHVPLFFVCSGYLYQKNGCVKSLREWKNNVGKKAVSLGIPYFTFSIVTWLLKNVFSDAVNIKNEGLLETLFVTPSSPYWFLYVLFFLFIFTPTFADQRKAVFGLVSAVILKIISIYVDTTSVYLLSKFLENEIWFVLGMFAAATNCAEKLHTRKWIPVGCILSVVFLALSAFVYSKNDEMLLMPFLMGILGCLATVIIMCGVFTDRKTHPGWKFLSNYTMPVFLMHTIFAAGWRSVLFKIGITNAAVHIVSGLVVSFLGPIILTAIMKRVKFLDFFLNPGKYIRFRSSGRISQ